MNGTKKNGAVFLIGEIGEIGEIGATGATGATGETGGTGETGKHSLSDRIADKTG